MEVLESVPGNPVPGGAFSFAVSTPSAGLLHLAGHVGVTESGERPAALEEEIALAIANLERTLLAAGGSLNDLIHVTCLLTDIDQFELFDSVYRTRIPQPWPARATFGVTLAGDLRFEIFAVARVVGGSGEDSPAAPVTP